MIDPDDQDYPDDPDDPNEHDASDDSDDHDDPEDPDVSASVTSHSINRQTKGLLQRSHILRGPCSRRVGIGRNSQREYLYIWLYQLICSQTTNN